MRDQDGFPADAARDAARDALPDVFVAPPAAFAPGQVDVDVAILTSQGRSPVSPLIYGIAALAYAFGGIELVHNADGNGLRFADTAVLTSNPDAVDLSVYAGMDTPGRVTVLVVNKTQTAMNVGLSLTNAAPLSTVAIYRIDAADPSPYLAETPPVTLYNAYPYAAPALSASMLVFESP